MNAERAAGPAKQKKIKSKHNNLLNYFIHDHRDLSPAYVRSCEEFFNTLHSADNEKFKRQASSTKRQASSATKKTQL